MENGVLPCRRQGKGSIEEREIYIFIYTCSVPNRQLHPIIPNPSTPISLYSGSAFLLVINTACLLSESSNAEILSVDLFQLLP